MEYREQLPLTLRQIFYRLVGAYAYEKSEAAYKRLVELMNKARRARLVDMDAIRDDGFTRHQPLFFASVENFLDDMASQAKQLRLDRQRDQERRLGMARKLIGSDKFRRSWRWCEAAGMVPQLAREEEEKARQDVLSRLRDV